MPPIEDTILSHLNRIADETGVDLAVTAETPLLDSGLLDSIALVGLVQFLEGEFGVAIPESDITPDLFETPATLAAYVAGRRA